MGWSAIADRSGVGGRCPPGCQPWLPVGRGLGVDGEHLPALPRIQCRPVPRLLPALVWHPSGAARCVIRNLWAPSEFQIPQLLPTRARRCVLRLSQLRGLSLDNKAYSALKVRKRFAYPKSNWPSKRPVCRVWAFASAGYQPAFLREATNPTIPRPASIKA